MTAIAGRLAGLLVAPAPCAPSVPYIAAPASEAVGGVVIGLVGPQAACGLAGEIATALAADRRGAAVVVTWGGRRIARWQLRARPAAVRLAATLVAGGHGASASGRVVDVCLGAEERDAAAELSRVMSILGDVPVVVVLSAARSDAFDPFLSGCDLAVVAVAGGVPTALVDAAVLGLSDAARLVENVELRRRFWLSQRRHRAALAVVRSALA